jgi:hypothetical protein
LKFGGYLKELVRVTPKEENKSNVFESKVLRRIFEPSRVEILAPKQLLYYQPIGRRDPGRPAR